MNFCVFAFPIRCFPQVYEKKLDYANKSNKLWKKLHGSFIRYSQLARWE